MKRKLLVFAMACLTLPGVAQLADSSDFYVWNVNQWEIHIKRTYTYNGQGQYLQVKEFNPLTGALDNQLDYSYTPQGKISMLDVKAHNGTQLVPFYRNINTYDNLQNPILNVRQEFNTNTQQWEVVSGDSISYAYNPLSKVTEYTIHRFTDGEFQPFQKLLFDDFGADSLPKTMTVQSYVQMQYQNFIQYRNISWKGGFDIFNINPSAFFGYGWTGFSWNLTVYDSAEVANGKLQRNYLFQWNGSSFDSLGRTDYAYDAMGHLWERLNLGFVSPGQWAGQDGMRDSIKYGAFDEIQVRTMSNFNPVNQQWNYLSREEFYYHGLGFGTPVVQSLNVYPNPCRDYLTIQSDEELKNVRVMDMQGKMYPVEMQDGRIATSGLAPGVYRISASGNGGVYAAQVLVMP